MTFSVIFAYVADITEEHERSTAYGLVTAQQPHAADFQPVARRDRKSLCLCLKTLETERPLPQLVCLQALMSDGGADCNSALCGYNGGPVSCCFLLFWRSAGSQEVQVKLLELSKLCVETRSKLCQQAAVNKRCLFYMFVTLTSIKMAAVSPLPPPVQ